MTRAEQVLEQLEKTGFMTSEEIAESMGVPLTVVRPAIHSLANRGQIEPRQRMRDKTTVYGYEATPSQHWVIRTPWVSI